jgi:hypothetical protein
VSEKHNIYELMARVLADVEPVGKNTKHQQQGFMYRGVDDVTIAADEALTKHGVIGPVPHLDSVAYESTEVGKNRTPTRIAQVTVTYRVYGPMGDYIETVVPGEAMDSGDKSTPKAMSVAYRIALLQLLRIPTGEKDPSAEDYRRSEPLTAPEIAKKAVTYRKNRERLLHLFNLARQCDLLAHDVLNENGEQEPLEKMLKRLGEASKNEPKRTAQRAPLPDGPEPSLDGVTA